MGGWEDVAPVRPRALAPCYLRAGPAVVLPERGPVVARIRHPQVGDAPAIELAARARDGRPVVVGAVEVDEGVVPAAAAGRMVRRRQTDVPLAWQRRRKIVSAAPPLTPRASP